MADEPKEYPRNPGDYIDFSDQAEMYLDDAREELQEWEKLSPDHQRDAAINAGAHALISIAYSLLALLYAEKPEHEARRAALFPTKKTP